MPPVWFLRTQGARRRAPPRHGRPLQVTAIWSDRRYLDMELLKPLLKLMNEEGRKAA